MGLVERLLGKKSAPTPLPVEAKPAAPRILVCEHPSGDVLERFDATPEDLREFEALALDAEALRRVRDAIQRAVNAGTRAILKRHGLEPDGDVRLDLETPKNGAR